MSYAVSFGAGLLVGIIYYLIHVRSPAPPLVALVGLLGMLAGEQVTPAVKHLLSPSNEATETHRVSNRTETAQ